MNKKLNLTLNEVLGIFRLLDGASLYNVTDKLSVLKLYRMLKPYSVEFEQMRTDTEQKLRPENFDELRKQYNAGNAHVLDEYVRECNACILPELERRIDIEFTPLSVETMGALCSKDMTPAIFDLLCEE